MEKVTGSFCFETAENAYFLSQMFDRGVVIACLLFGVQDFVGNLQGGPHVFSLQFVSFPVHSRPFLA